ncbi:MAG TPA: aspartate/glutamate racemase family protein [Clostridiales bacterium]|nr:aspartate/glutamate racemase family protein [Clostridiales bacterium]
MEGALGVLGGMGPLASQLFYEMVTEMTDAACDQEHIDMMILSHATMPDRTEAILSGDTKAVCDLLLEDCRMLEQAGCKAIVAACNTAHYFLHQIEPDLRIPLISMVRATAEAIAAEAGDMFDPASADAVCGSADAGRRIAILSTDGTIQTGLYQEALAARGLEPWVPDDRTRALVTHLIYDCVKANAPADRQALARLDEAVRAAGCRRALLACTELSVIARDNGLDDFYVDPMQVLAGQAILFMGKQVRRK